MLAYFIVKKSGFSNLPSQLFYYSSLLYIISLFLKDAPVVTNVFMVAMLLSSVLNAFSSKIKISFKDNKINYGIILFFLLQVASVFISEDKNTGFSLIIQRLPLLLLPLAFCFINYSNDTWKKLLLFYAIATLVASVVGFAYGVYCTVLTSDTGFLYNDNICCILGKQAVYFAVYVAIAILVFVMKLKQLELNQKQKTVYVLGIIWFLFIVFMLASRIAMFSLLLILFFQVVSIIIKKKKYLEGFLLIFGLIVGVVIVGKLFPKTLNRFNGTTEINYKFDNKNVENHFNAAYDSTKWNGTNTRMAIWTCALEVWKLNPILGTGLGDRNETLMNKYKEKQFLYAISTNKNTHSQYVDILLSMGVIGLLLFIALYFIYPILCFIKNKQTLAMQLFLLVAICMLTENMFDRYQGLVFIPFILGLVSKEGVS